MTSEDEKSRGPGSRDEDDDAYKIGYGKPPKASRFKPGQSGNPNGRPKGSRNIKPSQSTVERLAELVLTEAYRPIQIRDGGEIKELPAIQAALRSLNVQAAQGKQGAQRKLFELVQAVEAERMRNREELFRTVVEYKIDAEAKIAQARRSGLEEPEILPHPDDLVIDPFSGSVISRGPWTREEKAELDYIRTLKSGYEQDLELEESQPARKKDHERIAALESIIDKFNRILTHQRIIVFPVGNG